MKSSSAKARPTAPHRRRTDPERRRLLVLADIGRAGFGHELRWQDSGAGVGDIEPSDLAFASGAAGRLSDFSDERPDGRRGAAVRRSFAFAARKLESCPSLGRFHTLAQPVPRTHFSAVWIVFGIESGEFATNRSRAIGPLEFLFM
jgi:hypothetical protein